MSVFFFDHQVEQLLLQAFESSAEVDDGHLGAEFGQVVGIREARGDVQLELVGVVDDSVAELDLLHTGNAEDLLA